MMEGKRYTRHVRCAVLSWNFTLHNRTALQQHGHLPGNVMCQAMQRIRDGLSAAVAVCFCGVHRDGVCQQVCCVLHCFLHAELLGRRPARSSSVGLHRAKVNQANSRSE